MASVKNKKPVAEPGASPSDMLTNRAEYYEKRRFPPMIAQGRKVAAQKGQGGGKERSFSLALLVVVIVVGLVFAWVGIGALMKKGLLPYVDLGYTWLNDLIEKIRK